MGVTGAPEPVAADWLADDAFWAAARERLAALVTEHAARDPLALGVPIEAARSALGLPDRRLAEALAAEARARRGRGLPAAGAAAGSRAARPG